MAYATPAALISAKSAVANNIVVETIDSTTPGYTTGTITAGATALGVNNITGALTVNFYYDASNYTTMVFAEGAQVNFPQVSNSNFNRIDFSGTTFQILVLR